MGGPERPNIVLVSIDSLRADYCGYGDSDRDATPTLTEMATEGTAFERAIAPGPSTPESMPVIFTGQYPIDDMTMDGPPLSEYRNRIRRHMLTRDTLAERMSRLGYTTAAFTPNPFTSRHFRFDKGFDHFEDFMGEQRETRELYSRVFEEFLGGNTTASLARVLLNFWQREEVFKPWENFYDEIVEWTDAVDEPYFLWVFLMDAHNPYLTRSGYRSQSRLKQFHANVRFWWESHETPFSPAVHRRLVTAYEDAVRYADAFLDRLRMDLGDDPLFVVHGDHGEAFGEHGMYGHEPYLYPENVHVPLVVSGELSRSVPDPVSLRSLPEFITSAATGRPWDSEQHPYAMTRTLQGEDIAVYLRDAYYSQRGRTNSDADLAMLDRVIDRFSTGQQESQLLADVAGEVPEK